MQLQRPWKEYLMALKKGILGHWKVAVITLIILGWAWYVVNPESIWIGVMVLMASALLHDVSQRSIITALVIWIALGAGLAEHMMDDTRRTSAPTVFMIGFFVLFSGFVVWVVFKTWKEYQKSRRYIGH